MLILSRKNGEKIMINGGEVVIEVIRSERGRARIGIKAGANVSIDREEIFQKKRERTMKAKVLSETIAVCFAV